MYAKLFSRITESSLMEERINVRYTFVMMLAIADPEGYVIGTDVAIARRLNMPLGEFKECLSVLMSPDPDSNSQEEDGRRITVSTSERGYHVVNFVTYRELKDPQGRREYMREYMKKYRQRNSETIDVEELTSDVNSRKLKLTELTQAEAEAEAEDKQKKKRKRATPLSASEFPPELSSDEFEATWRKWEAHRSEIKKPLTPTSVKQQLATLAKIGQERALVMIEHTIEKGWTGLREPDNGTHRTTKKTQMPDDYEGL